MTPQRRALRPPRRSWQPSRAPLERFVGPKCSPWWPLSLMELYQRIEARPRGVNSHTIYMVFSLLALWCSHWWYFFIVLDAYLSVQLYKYRAIPQKLHSWLLFIINSGHFLQIMKTSVNAMQNYTFWSTPSLLIEPHQRAKGHLQRERAALEGPWNVQEAPESTPRGT